MPVVLSQSAATFSGLCARRIASGYWRSRETSAPSAEEVRGLGTSGISTINHPLLSRTPSSLTTKGSLGTESYTTVAMLPRELGPDQFSQQGPSRGGAAPSLSNSPLSRHVRERGRGEGGSCLCRRRIQIASPPDFVVMARNDMMAVGPFTPSRTAPDQPCPRPPARR